MQAIEINQLFSLTSDGFGELAEAAKQGGLNMG